MAFWGIEVKPGKPFTHSFDRARGRLRISQATLGIGSSTKKSLVQCNVGDKSPVFLCALLPDKTESCHLDLEFEEADEVVFSVVGPRSVCLTGYYLANGRHSNLNDDSDSYGEDIANTETDGSTHYSNEDEYEDSFIDDHDPEVFPPSPVSNDRVSDEEMLDKKKPNERKGIHKRLKKKYQSIDSDDEINSQQRNIINDCKRASGIESEDEDSFPISSLYKSRTTEAGEKFERETGKTGNKETEDDGTYISPKSTVDVAIDGEPERDNLQHTDEKAYGINQDLLVKNGQVPKPATDKESDSSYHSLLPSDEVGIRNHTKSKKKRKERTKEGRTLETDGVNHSSALKDDKALQDKVEDQNPATDRSYDSLLPSTEAGSEKGAKPRKRRKEWATEGKSVEAGANCNNVLQEGKAKQNEGAAGKSGENISVRSEQAQKFSYDRNINVDSNQVADGDQSEDKKTKKKKKKTKTQENEGNMDIDLPALSIEGKSRSMEAFKDKNAEPKSSQARTLSNGLIIEELEMGKPDGKIVAPGKKVKVHYIGKLRQKGQIFDSNIGKDPFKFRLGAEDVIEGWNIGLDGMRVGAKRRLIIPPSMGYGKQGAGENIPPNSWLVYEVKIVGVR